MSAETKKIQKTINAIKKDRPEYEDMLNLFGELIVKQSEFMDKAKVKPPAITKAEAQAKLKNGKPGKRLMRKKKWTWITRPVYSESFARYFRSGEIRR